MARILAPDGAPVKRLALRAMARVTLIALLALAVAGCGGGGSSSSKSNGEGSKSAQQIVADAAAALGKVKSFHVAGYEDDKSGRTTIQGDVALPGRLHLAVSIAGGHVELTLAGGNIYLKGDQAFWQRSAGRLSALLADKWVKAPPSATSAFGSIALLADPAKVGRCLLQSHLGTLAKGGTGTEAGKPVLIVTDKGDVPGGEAGTLYVAARGEPLPLRATQTGRQNPGGTPDTACNETASDLKNLSTGSDIHLSNYDEKITITAPPNALDLSRLSGSSA
jgi:hypothetical protein